MPRYDDWRYPSYEPVKQRRERARKKLAQLKKTNPLVQPVVIEGSLLARNWWGKSWNRNLERYADFSNRIGRGRSYVRHGAVLDLQIEPGKVKALVQGSRARPYQVAVRIRGLEAKTWKAIRHACAGHVDSLQGLLAGRFPEALAELFTARGQGLFPAPEEIEFDCSCPDWAYMCKHVAATLYGIGARLDEDPSLFFELRRVKMLDLICEAVAETSAQLLQKSNGRSGPVIADDDISEVFGIVMEDALDFENVPSSPGKVPAAAHKPVKKAAVRLQPRRRAEGVDEKRVLDLVLASRAGIDVPTLSSKTGFSTAEVRKVIYAAHRNKRIVKVSRGVFRGPQKRADPAEETKAVMDCIRSMPQGTGVAHIKAVTRLPDAVVRNILAKAHREGKLKRVSRGVYAAAGQKRSDATSLTRLVLDVIREKPEGATVADIKKRTGLFDRQVRNIIFRLLRLARIRRSARGVYQAM
jgi:uncharacterized Zn finger protein